VGDHAINVALESGLISCLRSIQRTNPSLFLSTQQLRDTERNVRHVPAVASALSSIVSSSRNPTFQSSMKRLVSSWNKKNGGRSDAENNDPSRQNDNEKLNMEQMTSMLEQRIRLSLKKPLKSKRQAESDAVKEKRTTRSQRAKLTVISPSDPDTEESEKTTNDTASDKGEPAFSEELAFSDSDGDGQEVELIEDKHNCSRRSGSQTEQDALEDASSTNSWFDDTGSMGGSSSNQKTSRQDETPTALDEDDGREVVHLQVYDDNDDEWW
jgi:hypothetical protein